MCDLNQSVLLAHCKGKSSGSSLLLFTRIVVREKQEKENSGDVVSKECRVQQALRVRIVLVLEITER